MHGWPGLVNDPQGNAVVRAELAAEAIHLYVQKRVHTVPRQPVHRGLDDVYVRLIEDTRPRVVARPHEAQSADREAQVLHVARSGVVCRHLFDVPRRRLLDSVRPVKDAPAAEL
eukprot:1712005-Prymnesium_polylepis.1